MKLDVKNLSIKCGRHLLFKNLNFSVKENEILHILGTNGSGKTTILKTLAGLASPFNGKILIKTPQKYQSSPCHYLSTKDAMNGFLTLKENMNFWYHFYKDQEKNNLLTKTQIKNLYSLFRLEKCKDIPFQNLSTGQKKKASFFRILLQPRSIWLLDEPFSGLDKKSVILFHILIGEHLKNNGLVILTSHQPLRLSLQKKFLYKQVNLNNLSIK